MNKIEYILRIMGKSDIITFKTIEEARNEFFKHLEENKNNDTVSIGLMQKIETDNPLVTKYNVLMSFFIDMPKKESEE